MGGARGRTRGAAPSEPDPTSDPGWSPAAPLQASLEGRAPVRLAPQLPQADHTTRAPRRELPGLRPARLPVYPAQAFLRCLLVTSAWLSWTLWQLAATLDQTQGLIAELGVPDTESTFRGAVAMSARTTVAFLTAVFGAQSVGVTVIRWRGTPTTRALSILLRREVDGRGGAAV